MRIILNILIVLMVAMLLAGVAWQHREHVAEQQRIEQAREEVGRFRRVISLHTALNNIERSSRGYPMTIDPDWFDDELPTNPLLNFSHPWLEIAHPDHDELSHPPVRYAGSTRHARFWYNPANGVVRARVPRRASDAATLRLYNTVNGTDLASLLPDSEVLDDLDEAMEADDTEAARDDADHVEGGPVRAPVDDEIVR